VRAADLAKPKQVYTFSAADGIRRAQCPAVVDHMTDCSKAEDQQLKNSGHQDESRSLGQKIKRHRKIHNLIQLNTPKHNKHKLTLI